MSIAVQPPKTVLPPRHALGADVLKQLFSEARTHGAFTAKGVPDSLLKHAVELAEFGPTSLNVLPMRIVFVRSKEAKAKLGPTLAPGNLDKTLVAPVTAIIAYDVKFYDDLPRNFPFIPDAREWFAHDEKVADGVASFNGALQGGYFTLALRALGLDAGPMGGFDKAKCDEAFFAGTSWKSNFLINIGYGEDHVPFPRLSRYSVDEMAKFI